MSTAGDGIEKREAEQDHVCAETGPGNQVVELVVGRSAVYP